MATIRVTIVDPTYTVFCCFSSDSRVTPISFSKTYNELYAFGLVQNLTPAKKTKFVRRHTQRPFVSVQIVRTRGRAEGETVMGVWTIRVLLLPAKRISAEGKKPNPSSSAYRFSRNARARIVVAAYCTRYYINV